MDYVTLNSNKSLTSSFNDNKGMKSNPLILFGDSEGKKGQLCLPCSLINIILVGFS